MFKYSPAVQMLIDTLSIVPPNGHILIERVLSVVEENPRAKAAGEHYGYKPCCIEFFSKLDSLDLPVAITVDYLLGTDDRRNDSYIRCFKCRESTGRFDPVHFAKNAEDIVLMVNVLNHCVNQLIRRINHDTRIQTS